MSTVLTIAETAYPAALTVSAAVTLMQRHGTMKAVLDALQTPDMTAFCNDGLDIVAALLEGGAAQARMLGKAADQPPTAEALRAVLFLKDLPTIRSAAIRAVVEGIQRQVEVEESRKNAETTQSP